MGRRVPTLVVTFLIPIREDSEIGSGRLHGPHRWKALENAIYKAFGGVTGRDRTSGLWRSPKTGNPVRDVSRVFEVDVPEDRLDAVRALLRRAYKTFVQQTIRVVIRGEADYISGGPDDEPL